MSMFLLAFAEASHHQQPGGGMIFNRKKTTYKQEEPVKAPESKPIKDTFVPDENGEIIVNGCHVHAKHYHRQIVLLSFMDDDIKELYGPWAGRLNDSTIIAAQQAKNTRLLTVAVKELVIQFKPGNNSENKG